LAPGDGHDVEEAEPVGRRLLPGDHRAGAAKKSNG
jgi:hypothetical protein